MKKGKSDLEWQAILEDTAGVLAVCAAKPGRHYGDAMWIAHEYLTRCTFIGSRRAGARTANAARPRTPFFAQITTSMPAAPAAVFAVHRAPPAPGTGPIAFGPLR